MLEVDLHGLTVDEAIGHLRLRLHALRARRGTEPLRCITGAGHHSPEQAARIRPAVAELVRKDGLRLEVENPGTFMIHLCD